MSEEIERTEREDLFSKASSIAPSFARFCVQRGHLQSRREIKEKTLL